ncbi:hypothetical protein [Nocardioides sp.]|uniref:hypothetical protein n=1 Tax=Nocardioides sp. TaxID=35761 RepID=UPI002C53623B|nr:hypothetical protein [Nocardioides sp.]HVX55348.1 hypothetical protein [Nocardioides sp.]
MSPTQPRRTRLGALLRFGWRATSRVRRPITRVVAPVAGPIVAQIAALAPVRVPLAIATAPLGRTTTPVERPLVALRLGGEDVTPTDFAVLAPAPTDRLLVLVPDVGHDERQWRAGSETTGATYAERLQHLLGWTPVPTRLDPGSPTEAGLELASVLQRLVEAWPVPVQRIAVIAAGNGGLAVRAACAVRFATMPSWTGRVSEVVGLGVPRYGVEPARLASDLGRRLDQQLAGIVVAEPSFLGLQQATWADHLLVTERPPLRPGPLGSLLGGVVWWRHRRGGRPRHVVDLFPDAESFELAPGEPLTNRHDVHDALLRWLA